MSLQLKYPDEGKEPAGLKLLYLFSLQPQFLCRLDFLMRFADVSRQFMYCSEHISLLLHNGSPWYQRRAR